MTLSEKLQEFGFFEMTDLEVESPRVSGAVCAEEEDDGLRIITQNRTVSHGDVYTANCDYALLGEIKKGDTIVVKFEIKNCSDTETNFLVDVCRREDSSHRSWLTRRPIFSPEAEFETCYFYAEAQETAEAAVFELTFGWKKQSVMIKNVQASRYPGTVREGMLERLPGMSRKSVTGKEAWYSFYGSEENWRTAAQQMIAKNRKGKLTVHINGADDAMVRMKQTGRDYYFGQAISADELTDEKFEDTFSILEDYYNIVTLANDLKWGDVNVRGVGTKPEVLHILENLHRHGMKVHGHVLFWPGTDRDPYDDGQDHAAEFVTTPPFIVWTVHIIQAMQKMMPIPTWYGNAGYGDGTIGTLRAELKNAISVYEQELNFEAALDTLTVRQIRGLLKMAQDLLESISGKTNEETTLEGVSPSLADYQCALRNICLEHIKDYAAYYGKAGAIAEWDVLNEIMNMGSRGVCNAIGEDVYAESQENVCQDAIYIDALKAAREGAGADIPLSYNDTSWQTNGRQRNDTTALLRYLKMNGAPLDFFGLQAYIFPQSVRAFISPEESWEEYDKFSRMGIQTEITEFDVTGFAPVIGQERERMLEADFLYDYIKINYAHPGSRGFIAWGGIPVDSAVGSVYYKLVYDELWTNEEIQAENGSAETDAFLGEYEVTAVLPDGRRKTVSISHDSTDGTELTIDF